MKLPKLLGSRQKLRDSLQQKGQHFLILSEMTTEASSTCIVWCINASWSN